ncbi:MAG: hypothetical protein V7K53_27645 [Nostoc sp.]
MHQKTTYADYLYFRGLPRMTPVTAQVSITAIVPMLTVIANRQ